MPRLNTMRLKSLLGIFLSLFFLNAQAATSEPSSTQLHLEFVSDANQNFYRAVNEHFFTERARLYKVREALSTYIDTPSTSGLWYSLAISGVAGVTMYNILKSQSGLSNAWAAVWALGITGVVLLSSGPIVYPRQFKDPRRPDPDDSTPAARFLKSLKNKPWDMHMVIHQAFRQAWVGEKLIFDPMEARDFAKVKQALETISEHIQDLDGFSRNLQRDPRYDLESYDAARFILGAEEIRQGFYELASSILSELEARYSPKTTRQVTEDEIAHCKRVIAALPKITPSPFSPNWLASKK